VKVFEMKVFEMKSSGSVLNMGKKKQFPQRRKGAKKAFKIKHLSTPLRLCGRFFVLMDIHRSSN
jgi:hypothetical protein